MLKQLCEQSLLAKLTTKTAAELFYLADLHSTDKLKAASLEYIRENSFAVMLTSSWDKVAVQVVQELRKMAELKKENKDEAEQN